MTKPDFITADTGPLIHLASCNLLSLMTQAAHQIIMPDVIVIEATRYRDKPYAREIMAWLEEGVHCGKIKIERTSTGELVEQALISNPNLKIKDAGERAIVDWLLDNISSRAESATVIYENGKVPKLIQNYSMNADIQVMTTTAFVHACHGMHLIHDHHAVLREMFSKNPTMNMQNQTFTSQRIEDLGEGMGYD